MDLTDEPKRMQTKFTKSVIILKCFERLGLCDSATIHLPGSQSQYYHIDRGARHGGKDLDAWSAQWLSSWKVELFSRVKK